MLLGSLVVGREGVDVLGGLVDPEESSDEDHDGGEAEAECSTLGDDIFLEHLARA